MLQSLMNTSAARIAANRANAQLSTGPRTEHGKQASSQNARRHGLSARELYISSSETEVFDSMVAEHRSGLQPSGAVEESLFDMIIYALWNMRRVRMLESNLFQSAHSPLPDPQSFTNLDRLGRYYQRFERSFHKALKELRTLQTNRALANVQNEATSDAESLTEKSNAGRHTSEDAVQQTAQSFDIRENATALVDLIAVMRAKRSQAVRQPLPAPDRTACVARAAA